MPGPVGPAQRVADAHTADPKGPETAMTIPRWVVQFFGCGACGCLVGALVHYTRPELAGWEHVLLGSVGGALLYAFVYLGARRED